MLKSCPFNARKDHVFKHDSGCLEEEEIESAAVRTRMGMYQSGEEKGDKDLDIS